MNAIARPQDIRPAKSPQETARHEADLLNAGPIYDARLLVGDAATARILLDGKVYVLRITRAGKLILTK